MDDVRSDAVATAPIDRRPLHDTATERLREMVYQGDLKPGDKVPEKQICDQLGISRTPLREALKVLASEGLLELLPNRGARVAVLTARDIDEIFPVMGALEALAGELACQRLTEDEFAEIRALHYQMALHHQRREVAPYYHLNRQIHELILTASGNEILVETYHGLKARIRHTRYQARMTQDRWDQAMREHEVMLQALEARDGKRLAAVLIQHLENKRVTVLSDLEAAQ